MKKVIMLFAAMLMLTLFGTTHAADTLLKEYEKARSEGRLDQYRESVNRYGGSRTKEEFNKIDKAQPGDTIRDTDKRKYIKRCGYGNANCTWEPVN